MRADEVRDAARGRAARGRPVAGALAALLVASAVTTFAPPCRAQAASSGDVAAAQALFEEGKRAMQQKDYATACPKLAESFRLDPAGGTAFALALCHESQGKTASAWADYDRALAIARRDHRTDRETAAADRARALEQRLVRVRVVVQADAPGLEVVRDGEVVGRAQWGVGVPVDPGTHAFEAHAPGKMTWKGSATTGTEGSTVDVVVPPLPAQPAAAPPPAPAPAPAAAPAPAPAAPDRVQANDRRESAPAESGSQRTWALVVGGVGLAAVAVGAGFGVAASSKWSTAHGACPNDRCTSPNDIQTGRDAGNLADISTIAIGAGVVVVGVAAILYFLGAPSAPPGPPPASAQLRVVPTLSPQSLGLSLGGAL